MKGIFKNPEEATKKYRIAIPEELNDVFARNPRSAVFQLCYKDEIITEGKYYGFVREISDDDTMPKRMLDACMGISKHTHSV